MAVSTTAKYSYDSSVAYRTKTLPALGNQRLIRCHGSLAKKSQANGTIVYSYDDTGRKTAVTYPGGIAVQYTYDADSTPNGLGRLASATVTGQAVDVTRSFGYDDYGSTINSTLQVGNPVQDGLAER
ncbi:hypothetical protein F2981_31540 (plasmid) [Sinorhizobium meliloti]|nr:hypothetical protein [Sinorhizobium meliloti]